MSQALLDSALGLRRAGRLAEAAKIYGQILDTEPAHFEALHALGILSYQSGRLDDAARLIGAASAANPRAADAAYNHACILQRLNRTEEALISFDRALAAKPDYIEALVNRGAVLAGLGRYEEALANADRVIALKPELAGAWSNRGGVLQALGRWDEALASIDRALALKPDLADGWNSRGLVLMRLQRHEDALAATAKALALSPKDPDLLARRADLLALSGRTQEAAQAYGAYLALKPEESGAWRAQAHAFQALGRRADAQAGFDRAVALAPSDGTTRMDRANFLYANERFEEAARDYEILSAGEGAPPWIQGYLSLSRLHCCDWRGLDAARDRIAAGIESGHFVLDPTGLAALSHARRELRQCARIWAAEKYPPPPPPLWTGKRYRHDRIRLAYLSADFRAHATAFLMAGIFESHDKNRFETLAISYGADDRSPMRARLERAFDRFLDVRDRSDSDIAQQLHAMEIDIAVDLKGYTNEARPGILGHRPAPVQAHYLGFPGTMGVDSIDYLIADPILVPDLHRSDYAEQIAYLPDTYHCTDRTRLSPARLPTRAELGLPPGFVFCCFNNNHKIMPDVFVVWMRLLRSVEGSVLWLLQDNPAVAVNLKREATDRGVAPERLIFAPRTSPEAHLARQACADLFLDTLPYNAHTTASDALWMGLPVLTASGSTFAGRVGASVLHAAGLSELVVASLADYEALALALARDPTRLAAIRARLAANRERCPLFDTARMTRSLEAAYTMMWEISQRGLPPASFRLEPEAAP
jgi:protein O-GlcNAc transferase